MASSVLAATVLSVSACSSGSGSASGSSPGTGSAAAAESAIVVGAINQGTGQPVAYPGYADGMTAAVGYINSLGGVDGHPLKLDLCTTNGTSTSTQACAEQMVQAKPLFVTVGLDNNMGVAYPLLSAAGIPVLGGTPVTGPDFTAKKDVFFFEGGSVSVLPGAADFITKYLPQVKKVGIIVLQIPAAIAVVPDVTTPLKAAGVTPTVVPVPVTATDYLPPLEAAQPSKQNALVLMTAPSGCVSLASAAQSQGLDIPVISSGNCFDSSVIKAANGGMTGWYVWSIAPNPYGTDSTVLTYRAALAKYVGSSASVGTLSEESFGNLMTVYDSILKPLGYSGLTSSAVAAKAADPSGGQLYFGGHYQCGQVSTFPSICSFQTMWFKVTSASGSVENASDGSYINVASQLKS
jgi:branched-chain amino acid transport system substrate-binding protein